MEPLAVESGQTDNETTTIWGAVTAATARLSATGAASPRLDAEVLMRHVLGLDRTAYFLRRSDPISPADNAAFCHLVARRQTGDPVAYIVGSREFMGLPFAVGPGVLVPRPETEILVEWALDWLRDRTSTMDVLDIGTGSGAIPLALATLAPPGKLRTVVACDISDAALRYAAANRKHLGLMEVVGLVRGDLGTWHAGGVDLLLANLPYLRPEQIAGNPDLGPEPALALDGGSDGLDLVRRVLKDAPRLLAPGGAIGIEIDPSQGDMVLALGRRCLPDSTWSVLPDLAGLQRHVVGVCDQPPAETRASSVIS